MSLKAKLESVIYAAEEPVTLAQLAAIFGEEALVWRAEANVVENEEVASEQAGEFEAGAAVAAEAEAEPEAVPEVVAEESAVANSEAAAVTEPEAEAEARRQARQREREMREALRELLAELMADFAGEHHGIEIREIAGGYRMATKPECHDAVRSFVKSLKPPLKLSLPALETLAVIAYKQPVTAPEVGEIRGVDSAGVLGSLISRKLITTAGRKQVVGRPILYKTTKEFLMRFGLKDLSELPSMEEFEKLAAMELDEPGDSTEDRNGYATGTLFAGVSDGDQTEETDSNGRDEEEVAEAEPSEFTQSV